MDANKKREKLMNQVKDIMTKEGIDRKDLFAHLDIARSTGSRMLNERNISTELLIEIADFIGYEVKLVKKE